MWKAAFNSVTSNTGIVDSNESCPPPLAVFILCDVRRFWKCEWWCGFEENETIAVELYVKYKNKVNECNDDFLPFDRNTVDLESVLRDPAFNLIYQVIVRYLECFDEAFDSACKNLGSWGDEGEKVPNSLIIPLGRHESSNNSAGDFSSIEEQLPDSPLRHLQNNYQKGGQELLRLDGNCYA